MEVYTLLNSLIQLWVELSSTVLALVHSQGPELLILHWKGWGSKNSSCNHSVSAVIRQAHLKELKEGSSIGGYHL